MHTFIPANEICTYGLIFPKLFEPQHEDARTIGNPSALYITKMYRALCLDGMDSPSGSNKFLCENQLTSPISLQLVKITFKIKRLDKISLTIFFKMCIFVTSSYAKPHLKTLLFNKQKNYENFCFQQFKIIYCNPWNVGFSTVIDFLFYFHQRFKVGNWWTVKTR